jgi:hypothetical protein
VTGIPQPQNRAFFFGRGKGGGAQNFFVCKINLKGQKTFPPAAGGQGWILRIVILITFFYLTFQGVKF